IKYALTQLLEIGFAEKIVLTSAIVREELDCMHEWNVGDIKAQETWISHLEKLGVFFSQPLDLDFMMFQAYPQTYKSTLEPGATGPTIPRDAIEYRKAVNGAVKAVLKPAGADGSTYSEGEKLAFFWYRYLFLGRSKPVSHFSALADMTDKDLLAAAP